VLRSPHETRSDRFLAHSTIGAKHWTYGAAVLVLSFAKYSAEKISHSFVLAPLLAHGGDRNTPVALVLCASRRKMEGPPLHIVNCDVMIIMNKPLS
jgi:hypothetical protein